MAQNNVLRNNTLSTLLPSNDLFFEISYNPKKKEEINAKKIHFIREAAKILFWVKLIMMMQRLRIHSSLAIVSLLFFLACSPDNFKKNNQVINGYVSNINFYGNMELSITNQEMIEAGYEYGDVVHIEGEGLKEEMDLPYVDNYLCTGMWGLSLNKFDDVDCLTLSLSNSSFSDRIGGVVNGKVQLSMAKEKGFLDKYQELMLTRTSNREDYESDEVFANFRMVTAGDISTGKIYRSSKPTLSSGNRIRYIYADNLAKQAGVQTLISLSDTQEAWDKAVESNEVGEYSAELYGRGDLLLSGIGVDFFIEKNYPAINQVMKFILNHQAPFMVFCDYGRDRTGLFFLLLELLADATYKEVESDYMKTYGDFYHINNDSDNYA